MAKLNQITAQAGEVDYALHTLGWKAFQTLCATILGEVWGQTFQHFSDSNDGGRDGAFHGVWKTIGNDTFRGNFTVQCKFTSKVDYQLRASDLKKEKEKARRLASEGLAQNYFLLTNARITGVTDEKIRAEFQSIEGLDYFVTYGAEYITRVIRESPRLRMLVPRVYGLGDLSQILDERACAQAKEILSSIADDLEKFVRTDAYQKSAKALAEHGFVLLLGEPACGKSTIAAALALGALDNWKCPTFKICNAEEFRQHSNPHEPNQFFWVDDVFGATQFDRPSADEWNRNFPHVQAAIRRGAKVLFTSRSYIYNDARRFLKESALPVLRDSQVVIHVEKLTKDEREQILYNHIRLGNQSIDFKRKVKPFLPAVAEKPRFSPEIARRLGNQYFTRELSISEHGLKNFVEKPLNLLSEIIHTIDAESRAALALTFMRGGSLPSPVSITSEEENAINLIGGSRSGVIGALKNLSGSLTVQILQDGAYQWRFKHPTIRDAFASIVAADRELMDIYLLGAPINRILQEVTCGVTGIQGATVIVPPDRYERLLNRFESSFKTDKDLRTLHYFLSNRCSREFMEAFIVRFPDFIRKLNVGAYLYAVSDVDVIVRLHEYGLLPEAKREYAVSRIRGIAVSIPDAGFLSTKIRGLLTPSEYGDIMEKVRRELIPDLGSMISGWRESYEHNTDPSEYFDELKYALDAYRDEMEDEEEVVETIESALEEIDSVIRELESEYEYHPENYEMHNYTARQSDKTRSIFDDVDQ